MDHSCEKCPSDESRHLYLEVVGSSPTPLPSLTYQTLAATTTANITLIPNTPPYTLTYSDWEVQYQSPAIVFLPAQGRFICQVAGKYRFTVNVVTNIVPVLGQEPEFTDVPVISFIKNSLPMAPARLPHFFRLVRNVLINASSTPVDTSVIDLIPGDTLEIAVTIPSYTTGTNAVFTQQLVINYTNIGVIE